MESTQSSHSVADNVEGIIEELAYDSLPTNQTKSSQRSTVTTKDLNEKAPSYELPSSSSPLN